MLVGWMLGGRRAGGAGHDHLRRRRGVLGVARRREAAPRGLCVGTHGAHGGLLGDIRGSVVCDGATRGTPKAGRPKEHRKTKRLGVRGKSRDWEPKGRADRMSVQLGFADDLGLKKAVIESQINQSTHAANHRNRRSPPRFLSALALWGHFRTGISLGVGFSSLPIRDRALGTSPRALEPRNGLARPRLS